MSEELLVDKRLVRRSFDHAAANYDEAAVLQREVSKRMLERLQYIKIAPSALLDAGSGTGYGSRQLLELYPKVNLLALDIAPFMLKHARAHHSAFKRKLSFFAAARERYVCGDVEALPVQSASMGMVWSNLTIQWCNDLPATFAEFKRVLTPGGLLMFSSFGPDTLKELRQAFAPLDRYTHVNRFIDMHDIGDMLAHVGFAAPVMDMEHLTLTYDDMLGMMRDLKALGAHNMTTGRRPGLTGKSEWRALQQNFEQFRRDGKLPATFEVIYGHAWKPETPAKTADGRQIIKFDFKRSDKAK